MSWLEIAAIVVLFMGIAAGGFLVSRRPTFWAGLGIVLFTKSLPYLKAYFGGQMTEEQKLAFRDCVRRGGEWDSFNKRCKDK